MYFVYLLKSNHEGKIYTGFTRDLDKRVAQHKSKMVRSTKGMGELELIYFEAFKSRLDAVRREKYLKTTKGKRTVRLMLKYSMALP